MNDTMHGNRLVPHGIEDTRSELIHHRGFARKTASLWSRYGTTDSDESDLDSTAYEAAKRFSDLDDWMCKYGFLPTQWERIPDSR